MAKKITYHKTHSFEHIESGQKINFVTQLYQVGVYFIVNNDPQMQGNITPNRIKTMEKKLIKDQEAGKIKDLEFFGEITVTDENGLWKEVE
jgi:hypothetical protein